MKYVFLCFLALLCTVPGDSKKQKQLKVITESSPEECSDVAATGDTVLVHYTGKLQSSGQVFDSSRAPGREPFSVKLGAGAVIKGWEEGLVGMCVGEVRRLIIPPHLAYGDTGIPGHIPGGATLEFEVELLSLTKKPFFSMPQGNGFITAIFAIGAVVVVVYKLYERASKQQEELRGSKKKDKETKRSSGKTPRKKNN